jgi:hypothetical protein
MAKKSCPESALARAKANGYKRRAHEEEDKKTGGIEYTEKQIGEQDCILDKYVT